MAPPFDRCHGRSSLLTKIRWQVLHKEDLGDFSRCYTGLGKQHDRAGFPRGELAGLVVSFWGGADGISVSPKKCGLFSQ